jgi:hypothetical protein
MIKIWHIVVFVLALVLFGIARAPVGLVTGGAGDTLRYVRADGTIWSARLTGAELAGLDAGEATWRLSLFDLFSGKFIADMAFAGAEVKGEVQLLGNWLGDRRIVVKALEVNGAPISPDLRLNGRTTIANLDIFFRRRDCETATGDARSDVLASNSGLLRWQGPELIGVAQCDGEWGRLPLVGGTDEERVLIMLSFRGDGEAEWQVRADTAREDARAALVAAGLAPDPRGALIKSAQWRWFPF